MPGGPGQDLPPVCDFCGKREFRRERARGILPTVRVFPQVSAAADSVSSSRRDAMPANQVRNTHAARVSAVPARRRAPLNRERARPTGHDMVVEDQSEVIGFLQSPSTHDGAPVERIDTHTAVVFLAGERAYKVKRAVRFDYLDFSTLERRRLHCEDEVRLNKRTAPTLYRGVVPVCRRETGELGMGGEGAVVEWLVEMNRFDQRLLLDRLATTNQLRLDLMPTLASAVAEFHAAAARRTDHGGERGVAWVIDGNAAGFAEFELAGLDADVCGRVIDESRSELHKCRRLLERRRYGGRVRQCHGDLHLGNVVVIGGRPTLFDGVEFNDEISCIDVMYDTAFLLMDLWKHRLCRHANAVLNRYLAETGDFEALALLPLFLSCRAAVKAKTTATAAAMQRGSQAARDLQTIASQYLAMADAFLRPSPPCLIAIGGLSGSGKSTIASALASSLGAAPGALVLRSDEIRKQLFGVGRLDRLGTDAYAPAVSDLVYQTLVDNAGLTVRNGHAAIVDAVWLQPEWRRAIEETARQAGVAFVGFWLDAPEPALVQRLEGRRNDPSDADVGVLHLQRRSETGAITWNVVDASGPRDTVVGPIRAELGRRWPAVANGILLGNAK